MNNLINRDFHEVIGKIVKFEMNEDLRLGQELLSKIPYNYIGEQEEIFKNQTTEDNPLAMSEEELKKLIPKVNFNLPETTLKLVEKSFIDSQQYWELYDLYEDTYPFSQLPKMTLYTYCRNCCGLPMTDEENKKIKQDMKTINKSMKLIKKKQMKKEKGVYNINF